MSQELHFSPLNPELKELQHSQKKTAKYYTE